ncbi:MAG: tRNA (adenosine(37)-N6)-threonylcarbamoyltransferase complex ATPase subunit type 1 TsaE [Pseudomonadota bacterium]
MNNAWRTRLRGLAETKGFAQSLALALQPGDTVCLEGDLGVGKSVVARCIVQTLMADASLEVPSPTFSIVQPYESANSKYAISHFDLYRLFGADELEEVEFSDAIGRDICLIEWPDRAEELLPQDRILLEIEIASADERSICVSAPADFHRRLRRTIAAGSFLYRHWGSGTFRAPMSGDASARRYETVRHVGEDQRILMDAPAIDEASVSASALDYMKRANITRNVSAFISIDQLLRSHGFKAPQIFAEDQDQGFLLLEDLGSQGLLDEDRSPIEKRYETAARFLAHFHQSMLNRNEDTLNQSGIPAYDREAMLCELALYPDWFLPNNQSFDREAFVSGWQRLIAILWDDPPVIVLRDYHSPNILWQPEATGVVDQIGLIDFQDALLGPSTYDLASLIQDARIDIAPAMQEALVEAYLDETAKLSGTVNAEKFRRSLAISGAQRNTKILGGFVRLSKRDGKNQYLPRIPAIMTYLRQSLSHPVFDELRPIYETAFRQHDTGDASANA